MIKLENTVLPTPEQWRAIIMGARNPMNSWSRSDSEIKYENIRDSEGYLEMGPNDHDLMMRLANGGPVHAKYRRMITVYVDITAPLYWWKEFDTYKIGTVANSCSTMHKIHDKEFELSDFSHEHLVPFVDGEIDKDLIMSVKGSDANCSLGLLKQVIWYLNYWRNKYLETKVKPMKEESKRAELMKKYWWQMIQLLPSSYNQKRTVMLNYEVLANIYRWRKDHKLDEWHTMCDWIEQLPYSEIITGELKGEKEE